MLSTKFRFNWLSSFREEDFQKSTNLKQELPVVAMFVSESGRNKQSLQRTFQGCFIPRFDSFGQAVSEEKIFQKSTNQKQELPVAAIFVSGLELNEQTLQRTFQGCFLPSFDSFGQVVSEKKIFQKSTNQKEEWPVVAMFVNGSEGNEHSLQRTFHRCFLPIFGSFGQAVSEEKIFRNRPIRNKNCLWQPCLLMDRDKMSNLQRGPSIDACYQVSVHLAEGFQRRRLKCEKLMDDRRRMASDGKISHCLWQGELKKLIPHE